MRNMLPACAEKSPLVLANRAAIYMQRNTLNADLPALKRKENSGSNEALPTSIKEKELPRA